MFFDNFWSNVKTIEIFCIYNDDQKTLRKNKTKNPSKKLSTKQKSMKLKFGCKKIAKIKF